MLQEKGTMTVADIFRQSNQNFLVQMSKEYGEIFTCIDDIWAYTEAEMRKHNTCKKCGYICTNHDHMERHLGNRECVRRQKAQAAKLANQEYLPDWKKKKWCDICKKSYSRYFKHEETASHKENLDKLLGKEIELKCTLCKKPFKNKKAFIRHLKDSKICHRAVTTADQYIEYAAMCEKLRVRWDPKIAIKTGQREKTIHDLSREELIQLVKQPKIKVV